MVSVLAVFFNTKVMSMPFDFLAETVAPCTNNGVECTFCNATHNVISGSPFSVAIHTDHEFQQSYCWQATFQSFANL